MSVFDDRIPVISSGNPMQTLGYINVATGMVVSFQNNYQDLVVTATGDGIITATGSGGFSLRNFHHLTNIKQGAAIAAGFPTGTNCFPFR
jgi:hypothetical protein